MHRTASSGHQNALTSTDKTHDHALDGMFMTYKEGVGGSSPSAPTLFLGGGVDFATVAGRLGHAGGGRTTLAVYAHMLDNTDRAAADLLEVSRRALS